MIKNENILCVSYTSWEGKYTKSVVQLMSLLARENKVLFVEYPYTIKDVVYGLLGKSDSPALRILGLKKRLQVKKTSFGTEVYNWVALPVLPSDFIRNEKVFRWVIRFNALIYRYSVKRALRKLKMKDPVNVNAYNPYFGLPLMGKLMEKANIYYCYDGMNTERQGNRAIAIEEDFSRKVDSIIVTSDYLKKQKDRLNSRVDTVKNGVDFPVFNELAKSVPHYGRKRKKIAYIGSVDQRFCLDFVEYAIRKLPQYDFAFVGDVRNHVIQERLSGYPNVKFFPPVEPNIVPQLLHDCDAGIIPYLPNEINKNVYPLKLNEYLAVGVPVVLTKFADLNEFEGVVRFTTTKEEFLEALISEIENDSVEKINARIEFARGNSWEKRAELFSDALEKVIRYK